LQKRTRSILDELDNLSARRDKALVIESRAGHVIQGAINFINYLKENYDVETAQELERRLLSSIKSQDAAKFTRGLKKHNETK
jgi:hypothetical protein